MTTEPGRMKPRIRKRTWLLLSLGAVLLVAVLWSALGGWDRTPLPEAPPLPVPNGYDDVLEAGREIEKTELVGAKFDLSKADQAALEPVVQSCAPAIARGRKALDKKFQVPVVYEMDHLMNVLLKDLSSIRGGFVRAVVAQGRLAEARGQVDQAAESYVDLIRLGDAMTRHVPTIAYLIAVAVESTGLHHLRSLRAKLSPEECRKIIALLEEIDRTGEPSPDVAARESQFMTANLRKMGFLARISMTISGMHRKNLAQVANSTETVAKRRDVALRLLLASLAVQVYNQEHGEPPPDLNALVPTILKTVPIDPYNERPLRYQIRGKDGVVYSFGPDRDDDMLMKRLAERHLETDDGDYTIDSF